jgi:predicted metal-dependent HD superfamily phosphohydrolase
MSATRNAKFRNVAVAINVKHIKIVIRSTCSHQAALGENESAIKDDIDKIARAAAAHWYYADTIGE